MGVVRREDVRGWEVDRVVCGEGFRVGDVVRSVVVSGFSSGYSRSLRACNVVGNDVPLLLFLREGGERVLCRLCLVDEGQATQPLHIEALLAICSAYAAYFLALVPPLSPLSSTLSVALFLYTEFLPHSPCTAYSANPTNSRSPSVTKPPTTSALLATNSVSSWLPAKTAMKCIP